MSFAIFLLRFTKAMALTMRQTVSGLDRHLKQNDDKISVAKGREFVDYRQEGKARGHRKRSNAAKTLTAQGKEQLWKNHVFGICSPFILVFGIRRKPKIWQMWPKKKIEEAFSQKI